MTFTDSQKKGVTLTVLLHASILLLLFLFGSVLPYPPPQEEGGSICVVVRLGVLGDLSIDGVCAV